MSTKPVMGTTATGRTPSHNTSAPALSRLTHLGPPGSPPAKGASKGIPAAVQLELGGLLRRSFTELWVCCVVNGAMSVHSDILMEDRLAWLLVIGRRLKREYDAVGSPLPPALAALLEQLEARERQEAAGNENGTDLVR